MFRDWRQRHVAPPESRVSGLGALGLHSWIWPWVMAPTLAHCAVISSDQDQDTGHPGKHSSTVHSRITAGNEVAFNCVSRVKCSWSGPLSWLSLLFSIFAARGISKLQEKSVSLQANGEMLGAPVLPHWAHLLTVAAMWNSQPLTKCYQLSPLL